MLSYQKSLMCVVIAVICVVQCCVAETKILDNTFDDVAESRTFGHHFLKRISFAIIPAAFVVGVITTLLAALTVVSIKGLGVGVVLLVIALGQMLARGAPQVSSYASAPIPVVYSHHSRAEEASPVWVQKDWS